MERIIKNRTCTLCEKEYSPLSPNQKYCNPGCSRKGHTITNKKLKDEKYYLKKRVWDNTYKLKNMHKLRAQAAVQRDKKKRPELYPEECMICGVTENIQFHHPLYAFQLSVYPMCVAHHNELHRRAEESQ